MSRIDKFQDRDAAPKIARYCSSPVKEVEQSENLHAHQIYRDNPLLAAAMGVRIGKVDPSGFTFTRKIWQT